MSEELPPVDFGYVLLTRLRGTPTLTKRLVWDSRFAPDPPPGNPEATPECDAIHDCDWIVYRCNYPADFDGGVAL